MVYQLCFNLSLSPLLSKLFILAIEICPAFPIIENYTQVRHVSDGRAIGEVKWHGPHQYAVLLNIISE